MFNNISRKLQGLAQYLLVLGLIGIVVCAIILFSNGLIGLGIGVLVGGSISLWITCAILYILGYLAEIVEEHRNDSYKADKRVIEMQEAQKKTDKKVTEIQKMLANEIAKLDVVICGIHDLVVGCLVFPQCGAVFCIELWISGLYRVLLDLDGFRSCPFAASCKDCDAGKKDVYLKYAFHKCHHYLVLGLQSHHTLVAMLSGPPKRFETASR